MIQKYTEKYHNFHNFKENYIIFVHSQAKYMPIWNMVFKCTRKLIWTVVVAHGIIESEFPNSSIQWDVCIFQLICMSPSYDHFLTGKKGYLPLTNVVDQRATQGLDFFLIWKILGCFL